MSTDTNSKATTAVRSWSVGGYTCTVTVATPKAGDVVRCSIEWFPQKPPRLTPAELRDYRAGRDRALASIGAELGLRAAVLEV